MKTKIIFAFLVLCLCLPVKAGSEGRVDRAIVHVLTRGIPGNDIAPRPLHPLLKNLEARAELVKAIEIAAAKHRVPEEVLVAISFREGSFLHDKTGAIGEKTTFQIVPRSAALAAKRDPLCSLETVQGSAYCAAAWLDLSRERCGGSLKGAIAFYVTGKGCSPKSDRVRWIVRDRLRLAKALGAL